MIYYVSGIRVYMLYYDLTLFKRVTIKMKMTKKVAVIIAVVACLAVSTSTVCAMFYVTSNATSSVTSSYTVSLTERRGYNPTFTLSASVVDNSSDGGSFVTNIPVTFYVSANGGDWTAINTSHTNSTGVATSSYSIQSNGETDQFQAEVGIP